MGDSVKAVPRITHCPTCLLIRMRDTSQKAILKHFHKSSPGDPDPAESESSSYSRPFKLEYARHLTSSYQAALEFFHGNPSRSLDGDPPICSLCDHRVDGLFTREWEPKEPIARIELGAFKEIEGRSICRICRFLCETISQSSFELDDRRILALKLGGDSYVCSCQYRAAAVILYKDVEEFLHNTYCPLGDVPIETTILS